MVKSCYGVTVSTGYSHRNSKLHPLYNIGFRNIQPNFETTTFKNTLERKIYSYSFNTKITVFFLTKIIKTPKPAVLKVNIVLIEKTGGLRRVKIITLKRI